MASVKLKQPKGRGAPSHWALRSQEKPSSPPPQPAPDIPNPLGELPAEGTEGRRSHRKTAASSVATRRTPDSPGDARASIVPPSVRGRRSEKKSAIRR